MELVNGSSCFVPEGGPGTCLVQTALETLRVSSTFHPCAHPPDLAVSLQMGRYGRWAFNFLEGNGEETRIFGPAYWPIWLRLSLLRAQTGYQVQGCLETVKTGESLCFLGQELIIPECPSSSSWAAAGSPGLALGLLLSLLLLLLLTLTAATALVYRRTRESCRYEKHLDSSEEGSCLSEVSRAEASTPPLLPGAARFVPPSPFYPLRASAHHVRFADTKSSQTSSTNLEAQPLVPKPPLPLETSEAKALVSKPPLPSLDTSEAKPLVPKESSLLVSQPGPKAPLPTPDEPCLPPESSPDAFAALPNLKPPSPTKSESDSGRSSGDKHSPRSDSSEVKESPL